MSAILGSANLGAIKLEATNRRQYEISALTTDIDEATEIASHIEQLNQPSCSANIEDIIGMPLVRETNTSLNGVELVTSVPQSNVDFYERCRAYVSFFLQLKVPSAAERHIDDGKHYKNKPIFVVTDDGYWFKAHTTSDNNKQFSAVGDELIMGRWLKGRLAAAGIVTPVNNTLEDTDRNGMITQEMLQEYGSDRLLFKKTGQTALDEDGTPLDVWILSFTGNDDEER